MSTTAAAEERRLLSVEEYVEFELASPRKHEYVAGQVFAMVGVSRRHSGIAVNIASNLYSAADDGPCRVHVSEVRLRASENIFYYPDVMVACGPEPEDPYIEDAPCLVVEVLSPSTATVDRREKLLVYRQLPSLQAYLIVHQEERRLERHWRDAAGEWRLEEVVGTGSVAVPCPETELSLEEIYARVS
jgi:Uma2 family endonuclease